MQYLQTTTDSTPEKTATLEKRFSLTPKSQQRIIRSLEKKKAAKRSKRRLFRDVGGGRKLDKWWVQVEPVLLQRFKTHRSAGCVVLPSHLYVWTIEICFDVGIDLEQLKLERRWKDFRNSLRKRIRSFCSRNNIKMKRASRQVFRDPKVGTNVVTINAK